MTTVLIDEGSDVEKAKIPLFVPETFVNSILEIFRQPQFTPAHYYYSGTSQRLVGYTQGADQTGCGD